MNTPSTIRVTADHIAQGVPRSSGGCPIACAIREQYQDSDPIDVGNEQIIRHDDQGRTWTAQLPGIATCFIFDFDSGAPLDPLEFAVEWVPVWGP